MIPVEPQSPDALCVRLRRERERRQIALSSISANTKISVSLFEALERGDVSRWPAGIYRRSFVRAYAQAIGLDPDSVAREFAEQFPDPAEPPPAPAVEHTTAPPVAAAAVAVVTPASDKPALRLKLADSPTPFVQGRLLAAMRQRLVAVACDGGVVTVIALGVFLVCGRFWLPLGIAMIGYYLGGILLLGNTPGVCLCAPDAIGAAHYNRLDEPGHSAGEQSHSPWHFGVPAR
jgi:transcriptional regulator with XRE-family HTH domain